MREVTHALFQPETALAAVEALRGACGPVALDGLIDLLYEPPSARAAINAITALGGRQEAVVIDALTAALDSPHALVRLAAVESLRQRRQGSSADLQRSLQRDPSWPVRRAALRALADRPEPDRWLVLAAADDPHWRMRHTLIQVLLEWGDTDARRRDIDARLAPREQDARAQGVRAYLHWRWYGTPLPDRSGVPTPEPSWPFWDWDAAVLVRQLERLGEAGRRQALDAMPQLLAHADSRVRGVALETLRRCGETRHLAEVVALLGEPRTDAIEAVTELLAALDLDRTEAVARHLLRLSGAHSGDRLLVGQAACLSGGDPGQADSSSYEKRATPAQLAWAVDQAGEAFPVEEEEATFRALLTRAEELSPTVRRALERLAARWRGAETTAATTPQKRDEEALAIAAADPDARVRLRLAETLRNRQASRERQRPEEDPLLSRLQSDPNPRVRAAALTPARAAYLLEDPTRETSWHVLAAAARMAKVPFWKLEPKPPWQPPAAPVAVPEPLHLGRFSPRAARLLGPGKLLVSPLGVSGHYGLPVEGFVRAAAAGVNLLFWEPNYQTLTEFLTRLPPAQRNEFHVITGTFEADGKRVERDAERALRLLQIDRIALFLLFWVQSWNRVTPDVREALERLREKGLVANFSLSTHSRPLAVRAMQEGWNPVMVRHSAAHQGAEEQVLPRARELGTSIITFNNTCYGRLLQPSGDLPPPDPADCYRYTLAQPAVTACLSAPATLEQLETNLAALLDPELPPERRQALLARGERVYQEDVVFRRLVRSR
jgi:HEAT repeat protein